MFNIVEIGPEIGECPADEYPRECERLERCYTAVEGDEYCVIVRPAHSGEAPGTYLVQGNGNLQILGYSLPIEDMCPGLAVIRNRAWQLFAEGATVNAQLDKSGYIVSLRVGAPDGNRDEVTLDLANGETPRVGDHVDVDEYGVGTLT